MLRALLFRRILWLAFALLGCRSQPPAPVQSPGAAADVEPESPCPCACAEPEPQSQVAHLSQGAECSDFVPDHGHALVPVTAADPQWGCADAPVTIVEVADFECPFSSRVQATLRQIRDTYGPEQVRIVWKHNPLPFHKFARPAHDAASAVHGLGGDFWVFHDLAFQNQRALTDENLTRWAVEAGVDPERFARALEDGRFASKVDEDMAMGRKIGATGTPAFRINGVPLSGAQPFEKFQEVIERQLAEARELIAAGKPRTKVYPLLTARHPQPPTPEERPEPAPDTTVWKVPVLADDPVQGPPDALVTIVEFADFQCPFCKRVLPTLEHLQKRYGRDLRLAWKDNPLAFHPRARPAANLARAVFRARGHAAFWEAHKRLFASQPALEEADLKPLFADIGVPWTTLDRAMQTDAYAAKIENSQDLSLDVEARGTPHFFINGVRLTGARPIETFEAVIDAELAKARALVAAGTPRARVYETLMADAKTAPPPPRKTVAVPRDAPVRGNPKARLVLQMFGDFECPFSARALVTVEEILAKHNDVRVVWRNLPLPFHTRAMLAAEAAHEVYVQKGDTAFWAYHDRLFATQKAHGLERGKLETAAKELGVNLARFRKALDEHTHRARIEADASAARQAGIAGTPAFLLQDYYVSGAQPYSVFKKTLRRISQP